MPGFDRTGPMGAGPMTGGRRGLCNPAYAGYAPSYGGGFGYGRGRGRGFRRGLAPSSGWGRGYGRGLGWRATYPAWEAGYAPAYGPYNMNPQDEATALRDEAEYIKQELDSINKRISELESKSQPSQ